MKTYLDWSAYDTYGIGDAYSGIPATGGNYAKAVAVCMHSHDCRKAGKGLMCPSFRITGDPAHTTEARVAAFKAALNGEFGESPFTDPRLAAAMDLCVSCKGCKKECPSAVDMTLIKTEYLAHRNAALGTPLRTRLFANLPRWTGYSRTLLRLVIGLRNRSRPLARLAEGVLGIAAAPPLPRPARRPFTAPAIAQDAPRGDVFLFADTFSTHFEPDIANAAVEVLTAAGYRVRTAQPAPGDPEPNRALCCGRTYLTHGLVEEARREGRRVLEALRPAIEAKTPIIGLEPSCLLSLRDELYCLGLGPQAGELGKQLFLFEEFFVREQARGLRLPLKEIPAAKALVHGHCHQKAFGTMKAMRKILGAIPGLTYELIESSCCGMAGSFGLEAEHYEASQAMAGLSLLPALRAASSETRVIANGFSCRHQIAHGSGRTATHVALLLREALDKDKTA
ncbi:MAG: (Fe-S)-binding protein [Rhodomicrobium sp.]